MINSFKYLLLLLAILLLYNDSHAQKYIFDLQEINVEQGLPSRRVTDIMQDQQGFIWLSTAGAISRYDGKKFKVYNSSFLNVREYANSSIATDKNNHLWYLNDNKVTSGVIDTQKDTIYTIQDYTKGIIKGHEVRVLRQSNFAKDEIFILTKFGVVYKTNGITTEVVCEIPHAYTNTNIAEIEGGFIFVLSGGVAYKIDINSKKIVFEQALETIDKNNPENNDFLINFVSTQPDLIVESWPWEYKDFKYWILKKEGFVPLPTLKAKRIIHPTMNLQWIATKDSIIVRDNKNNVLYKTAEFKKSGHSIKLKFLDKLIDNQNNIWLSTENGLLKLSTKKNPFKILSKGNSTRGLLKHNNHLWIGGYFGNFKINLENGQTQPIAPEFPGTFMSFLHRDTNTILAVSGFEYFEIDTNSDSCSATKIKNSNITMLTMFECLKTGKRWYGTNKGIIEIDEQTKEISSFPLLKDDKKQILVNHVYSNNKGFWISTNKGLFLVDDEISNVLKHFSIENGFPYDNLKYVYEDQNGIFWIATNGAGLIRWDQDTNEFKQFKKEDGLSNNVIYCIYEDDNNNLWLPSNYGLMCFNKTTYRIQLYLSENGIAHEEFNTYSHLKDENGTMFFGGIQGITMFHPDSIIIGNNNVPLYINSVRVLEKNSDFFNDQTKDYVLNKYISLSPNDKILELEYSMLNFDNSDNKLFAYQIEDYHPQWIYTEESKISLINLPHGNHNLKIKCRDSNTWSSNILTVPIHVETPLHLQVWFIILATFCLIAITLAAIKLRFEKLNKDKDKLEAEVQNRTWEIEKDRQLIASQAKELQEIDKVKSNFFSNITHEFRTPLTLIIGPVEQMLDENLSAKQERKLKGVYKNSLYLLQLINQLLDLVKLENKDMKIVATQGDIISFSQELFFEFKSLADKKNQNLIFDSKISTWKVRFDKEKWHIILFNLLSNAIKFTPNYGEIKLSLSKITIDEIDHILAEVKDNGIGLNKKNEEKIFQRFYQIENNLEFAKGTGIGLSLVKELVTLQNGRVSVQSELGKGTTFKVILPEINANLATTQNTVPGPLTTSTINTKPNKKNSYLENTKLQTPEKFELLIIEDNEEMSLFISDCIDETKYNIHLAKNGVEGLEIAINTIPDIIISDVMMPLMDGYELTQNIRTNKYTSHIPIILLTAKSSLDSRLEGIDKGADVYLTKPFSHKELNLRIKKLLEMRQLLHTKYQQSHSLNTDHIQVGNNEILPPENNFVLEVKAIILKNLSNQEFSVELLSKELAMSRMQLHRKIKALTGKPISEHIRKIRLEHAAELLKKGNKNIAEIAYESGFTSPNYFATSFKNEFGKSPSEFLAS